MKITRLHRAIILMIAMAVTGFHIWLFRPTVDPLEFQEIFCFIVMLAGVGCCAYSMKFGLKRVLSVAMIVLGVYLSVRVGVMMFIDGGDSLAAFLLALGLGLVSCLLGFTIWLGYEYNIVRVRMCMLIIMAGSVVVMLLEGWLTSDFNLWLEDAHLYIILTVLSGSVVFVTMDPSMDLPTMATGAMDNIIAMRRRLICTEDAYILSSDEAALKQHIDSGSKEPIEVLVRSNDSLSFNLILISNDDGEHLIELRDLQKIFMPTLHTMKFTQVVFADDHVTFYDDNGVSMKILVFEQIQENMNLPLIFGRELNIQKKV
ncbi:MAG: hypothetical protein IKQ14_01575 [Candidatus Methanomethylophilaceae archaeon]|nr:hypothetical protein [Candidatus Methanomethylophilaceae archaeon]